MILFKVKLVSIRIWNCKVAYTSWWVFVEFLSRVPCLFYPSSTLLKLPLSSFLLALLLCNVLYYIIYLFFSLIKSFLFIFPYFPCVFLVLTCRARRRFFQLLLQLLPCIPFPEYNEIPQKALGHRDNKSICEDGCVCHLLFKSPCARFCNFRTLNCLTCCDIMWL